VQEACQDGRACVDRDENPWALLRGAGQTGDFVGLRVLQDHRGEEKRDGLGGPGHLADASAGRGAGR